MFQNKVVARYLDGRVLKGFTNDFAPAKDHFHLNLSDADSGSQPLRVQLKELKAVFFVKTFEGRPEYSDKKDFDTSKPVLGKKIRVVFSDGELFLGTTQGYQPGRPAFFVIPADSNSNIERCFVVSSATSEISMI